MKKTWIVELANGADNTIEAENMVVRSYGVEFQNGTTLVAFYPIERLVSVYEKSASRG